MSRFVIQGGRPLEGEIRASGSKNAVLPMIAAALLTDEEIVLENVPSIRDVDVMLEIAGQLGADVSRVGDQITIRAANLEVLRGQLPQIGIAVFDGKLEAALTTVDLDITIL